MSDLPFRSPVALATWSALSHAAEQLRGYWSTHLAFMPDERGRAHGDARFDGVEEDLVCREILREALQTVFDEAAIVMEDDPTECVVPCCGLSVLVDPLDGTSNALIGYPAYTSSVAVYAADEYVFGWVLDISRDLIYVASAGEGAFRLTNDYCKRLLCRRVPTLEQARVSFLRPDTRSHSLGMDRLTRTAAKIRLSSCSSLDLCLIAAGALDAFIDLTESGRERSCDVAAAALILAEAGGQQPVTRTGVWRAAPPSPMGTKDYVPLLACGSKPLCDDLFQMLVQ